MAKHKRHHASHKAHSARPMEKHEKRDGAGRHDNKASVNYDSYAGMPSHMSGLPMHSFISHWGSNPSFPSDRYPNGIDDIDGIEKKMHEMMNAQASDRLY